MTETTEQIITRLAKERVKTILENGDFWGSPGAANTSATAITTLIAIGIPAVVASEESPAAVVREKRISKAKEQAAATAEANDTDATDA